MLFFIAFLISAQYLIDIGVPIPLLFIALCLVKRFDLLYLLSNFQLSFKTPEGIVGFSFLFVGLAIPFHYFLGVFNALYLVDFVRIGISIVMSYLIYKTVYLLVFNSDKKVLTRNFYIALSCFIFICALEILPGIGSLLHSFYYDFNSLFSAQELDVLRSEARGLGLFGRRPLFFMSEPSHVAKFSLNLTLLLVLLQFYTRKINYYALFIIPSLLAFLIQSPIAFAAIVLVYISLFLSPSYFHIKLLFSCFLVPFFIQVLSESLARRSELNWAFADSRTVIQYAWQSSFAVRSIIPFYLSVDIFNSDFNLFGLGLNAKQFAQNYFSWLSLIPEYGVLGNNALFKIYILWGFYGLFVGAIFLYILYSSLQFKRLFFILLTYILFLSFSTGSIDSYLWPSSLVLILGVNNGLADSAKPSLIFSK